MELRLLACGHGVIAKLKGDPSEIVGVVTEGFFTCPKCGPTDLKAVHTDEPDISKLCPYCPLDNVENLEGTN